MVATHRQNGRAKRHNGNGHDLTARLSTLRGDFGQLQRDVRGLVSDVGDAAENQFESAVNGTVKSARNAIGRVESWGNQKTKIVRQSVKKQPMMACAIAAGAGALIGLLLTRGGSGETDCE
jgi:ElaB/YqjD/DUF883 family membrane-anchored ribosome-binding protein